MEMSQPLLEITLEKPALIEEIRYPGESSGQSKSSGKQSSSGGGKGKLLVMLAMVAVVGMLAMKMKSSGKDSTGGGQSKSPDEEYEHGPDPEIGGDKKYEVKRKVKSKVTGVLGIAVAVIGLAVAAWKRRN